MRLSAYVFLFEHRTKKRAPVQSSEIPNCTLLDARVGQMLMTRFDEWAGIGRWVTAEFIGNKKSMKLTLKIKTSRAQNIRWSSLFLTIGSSLALCLLEVICMCVTHKPVVPHISVHCLHLTTNTLRRQSGLLSRCPRSSIKRLSLHYTRLQIRTRQQGKHSCYISLTSAA